MTAGPGRPRIPPRRFLLALSLSVIVGLILTTAAHGARNQDLPENKTFGLASQGIFQRDCLKCHTSWGMTDTHVVIPIFPQALDLHQRRELRLAVENSWNYAIAEVRVQLNLSNAPGIVPLVGKASETPPPLNITEVETIGNAQLRRPGERNTINPLIAPEIVRIPVDVGPNPLALHAEVDFLVPDKARLSGQVESMAAYYYEPGDDLNDTDSRSAMDPRSKNTDLKRELVLPHGEQAAQTTLIEGRYVFEFVYEGGDAPDMTLAFNATVVYQRAGSGTYDVYEKLREPLDPALVPPATVIPARETLELPPIPIIATEAGPQEIRVMVQATLYYDHTGGTPDEDSYRRVAVATIPAGDTYVGPADIRLEGAAAHADLYLKGGEIAGFASAFLLVPSLVFGGTYGKPSRQLFNVILGGAKRRVMFHSFISFGLTLLAFVHIAFFFLEGRYTVLMGLLWGGLAAVSLLILGLTGYYQVPLIQKYGYDRWRLLHLAAGVLVILSVAVHAVLDGPDFSAVRGQVPQWVQDANLAKK